MPLLLLVVMLSLGHSAPITNAPLPQDCDDVYTLKTSGVKNASVPSGVYTIYPAGPSKAVQVFCDMGCVERDGQKKERWTVIQRRIDGNLSFYRPWEQYKHGFGDAKGEYWLGLENIFLMTNRDRYELRVDMEDFERGSAFAQYTTFYLNSESNKYTLNINGYINGGAGDSLTFVNGREFATYDTQASGSCAEVYGGGFWYYWWPCHYANPNGLYKYGNVVTVYTGITWQTWKGYYYSLKSVMMKIRKLTLEDLQNL